MSRLGRPSVTYRTSNGVEIKGLQLVSKGRWRISVNGQRFTEHSEARAIQYFYQVLNSLAPEPEFVSMPLPETTAQKKLKELHPDISAAIGTSTKRIGIDIPKEIIWAWVVEQIEIDATNVAKMLNIDVSALRSTPKKSLRLGAILKCYKDHANGIPESKRLAENTFNEFISITNTTTLNDLTVDNLKTYRATIIGRLKSPGSIASYFGRVKNIIRFGISEGLANVQIDNALSMLAILKAPPDNRKLKPTPIAPDEFSKIIEVCKKDYPNWTPRLWVMLNCCLHFGEAMKVEWIDLDLNTGTYCSNRNKTGKVIQAATLWTETIEALKAIKRTNGPYVFTSKWGKNFNPKGQWKSWKEIRNTAHLPHLQLDDIRDGAYTAACRAPGVDEKFARLLAGHMSPGLQDIYVQRNPEQVKPACDAVYAAYFGKVIIAHPAPINAV